jgi:uracil-DNA glycosylase
VRYVSDSDRNPFGMSPPCDRYVPGYGDPNADFHVVGDSPAVHGGLPTGIPFANRPWSGAFFDALRRAGLVEAFDPSAGRLTVDRTFLSYLCLCDTGERPPDADDYAAMEPYFDAELRAITAHVLLPVGPRATEHVLRTYTARDTSSGIDMEALHGTEIRGSGWLVVPVRDPAEWGDGDADRVVEGLNVLRDTDYRRETDLGRFLPDEEPYFVR